MGPVLFVLACKAIGIPIAAGVLYPFLGWRLLPMIAAAALALALLSVVGNGNRLRRYHPPRIESDPAANQPDEWAEGRRRYLGIEVIQRSGLTLTTTEPDTATPKEDPNGPSIQALTA